MNKELSDLTVGECLAALLSVPSLVAEVAALRKEVAAILARKVEKPAGWVRLKDAAEQLNVSTGTSRRFVKRGLLSRNNAFRHILIHAEDIERYPSKVVPNQATMRRLDIITICSPY